MRLLVVPLYLLVAGSLRVCSSDEKSSVGAAASAEATSAPTAGAAPSASAALSAVVTRPRIGGSVASVGDLSVELAFHEHGLIEALVSDATGLSISAGVKLSALVEVAGGANEKVELAFVPARARFSGQTKASVELAPGPVAIAAELGGKVRDGKLVIGVVVPQPRVGGEVLAAGNFSAEVLAHRGGELQAFVRDSAGVALNGEARASFLARCKAISGATEEIALHFDPLHACFAGKAKAGVELEPGPLEFVVDAKVGAGIGGLERMALTIDASHGGQAVAVGDYSVELVATGGEVRAFAFDALGKAQTAGNLQMQLDVGASGASKLGLVWDAACVCYAGHLAGNLDLSLQPIRVSIVANGQAFLGAVASLQAAAKASLHGNARLDTAKLDADAALNPSAKLAAQASAKVAPKLDAKASASLGKGASGAVKITPPKVSLTTQSKASEGAKAGGGVKASAGFSLGSK